MQIKDIFSNATATATFITNCCSGITESAAFPKTASDIVKYVYIFNNKYRERIITSFWAELLEDEDARTTTLSNLAAYVNSLISYSCNKAITAWEQSYSAASITESEDFSAFAYNSNISQPTSTRQRTTQKPEQQKAILQELELRKNSIIDYIIASIVSTFTLHIY